MIWRCSTAPAAPNGQLPRVVPTKIGGIPIALAVQSLNYHKRLVRSAHPTGLQEMVGGGFLWDFYRVRYSLT